MEQKPKRTTYVIVGVIAIGLITLLWVRYAATQRLVSNLGSRDAEIRVAAARELLSRETLADILPSQPTARRERTARALREVARREDGKLREAAITQLITMLKDPDDPPQLSARNAMYALGKSSGKLGKQVRDLLIPVLKDVDGRAKAAAKSAFILIGHAAIKPLEENAVKDPALRDAAVQALGDIGAGGKYDPQAKPVMYRHAAVPEAFEVLLQLAQQTKEEKKGKVVNTVPDKDVQKPSLTVLGDKRVVAAISVLLRALQDKDLRPIAIRALGSIGIAHPAEIQDAVQPIITALSDPKLRLDTARALGRIGDPQALLPLSQLLGEKNQELRDTVVWAVQQMGPGAVPVLAQSLKSPEVVRRRAAAQSLAGMRDQTGRGYPTSVPVLAAALKDPDWLVRVAAAEGLAWQGNQAGIAPLLSAFDDREWKVVDAAINSLGEIGSVAVNPLIQQFTAGPVRAYYARRALAKMDPPPLASLIAATHNQQNPDIAKWAVVTLGVIGPNASPAAREALSILRASAKPELAWVAKEALRKVGGVE